MAVAIATVFALVTSTLDVLCTQSTVSILPFDVAQNVAEHLDDVGICVFSLTNKANADRTREIRSRRDQRQRAEAKSAFNDIRRAFKHMLKALPDDASPKMVVIMRQTPTISACRQFLYGFDCPIEHLRVEKANPPRIKKRADHLASLLQQYRATFKSEF